MKRKVLIAGATGFLGRALSLYLAQKGCEVVRHGFSNASDVQADLTEPNSTEKLLDAVQPHVVINLVALTDVDRCEVEPLLAYRLNVKVTENLVRWLKLQSGAHLIQLSTDQVYDGEGPHLESDIALTNYYSFSKYCGELLSVQGNATVIRTNFFGLGGIHKRNFVEWLLESSKDQKTINLATDIFFSPLSVCTLVKAIALVVQQPVPGVYNLGSHGGMSKFDFGVMLVGEWGVSKLYANRIKREELSLKAYRPSDMRMALGQFEETYGVALPTLADEVINFCREARGAVA